MVGNRSHVGESDRSRLAASERYEIQHLAERHGLSTDEARDLIERFGNDRETLEKEAAKLRSQ